MSNQDAIGEIIGSDSQLLQVECHRLYGAPAFGSVIRAECVNSGTHHFAVVTRVSTAPVDSTRVVQAHQLPPGELEQRKPHLVTLLRTTFEARPIGYGRDNVHLAGTAPRPPQLHCFAYPATDEEIRALTRTANFLRPLLQISDVPLEDLLVSTLQTARNAWPVEQQYTLLIIWGKFLARLLRSDYVTLEGILERVGAVFPAVPPPISPPRPAAPARSVPPPRPAAPPAEAPSYPRWEGKLPVAGSERERPKPSSRDFDPFEEI